jgi:hypothetical protein
MKDQFLLNYVFVAAEAVDLPLTTDRAERVAAHLSRTLQMARMLEEIPIPVQEELAQLYVPAPFPASKVG